MLATHQYNPTTIDLSKGEIFDCCKKENVEDPKCLDCCYDNWRDEQKKVADGYLKKKEEADQISNKLIFIKDRRDRYKKWVDELEKVNELAGNVCAQLEIIVSQSDRIWYSSCKAADAVGVLFCMIRDFFMQIDKIKTYYDDIQKCISVKSLDMSTSLMTSYINYGKNLDAVLKTRDEIIKIIIDSIRLSNLIRNSISSKECTKTDKNCKDNFDPCKPDEPLCVIQEDPNKYSYGFKTIMCDWYNSFNCKVKCEDNQPKNCPELKPCDLNPMFCFPICKDDYNSQVHDRYNEDVASVNDLINKLTKANKEKESMLACKNSLDRAIAEVNPNERCKN